MRLFYSLFGLKLLFIPFSTYGMLHPSFMLRGMRDFGAGCNIIANLIKPSLNNVGQPKFPGLVLPNSIKTVDFRGSRYNRFANEIKNRLKECDENIIPMITDSGFLESIIDQYIGAHFRLEAPVGIMDIESDGMIAQTAKRVKEHIELSFAIGLSKAIIEKAISSHNNERIKSEKIIAGIILHENEHLKNNDHNSIMCKWVNETARMFKEVLPTLINVVCKHPKTIGSFAPIPLFITLSSDLGLMTLLAGSALMKWHRDVERRADLPIRLYPKIASVTGKYYQEGSTNRGWTPVHPSSSERACYFQKWADGDNTYMPKTGLRGDPYLWAVMSVTLATLLYKNRKFFKQDKNENIVKVQPTL